MLFIDYSEMARMKINTKICTKVNPYTINLSDLIEPLQHDKFEFLQNWKRQKSQKGELNKCIYVSKLYAGGIFMPFPGY